MSISELIENNDKAKCSRALNAFSREEVGGIKPPQIIVVSTLEFLPISFLVLLQFSTVPFGIRAKILL